MTDTTAGEGVTVRSDLTEAEALTWFQRTGMTPAEIVKALAAQPSAEAQGEAVERKRMAYKTGYQEGVEDSGGNFCRDACEEGWGQYAAKQSLRDTIDAIDRAYGPKSRATSAQPDPVDVAALREALEKVRDWIRYELPVPTSRATTMLGVVNAALSKPQSGDVTSLREALERLRAKVEATRDCSVCDGDGKVQRHDPPYGLRDCGGCDATGERFVLDGQMRTDIDAILAALSKPNAQGGVS